MSKEGDESDKVAVAADEKEAAAEERSELETKAEPGPEETTASGNATGEDKEDDDLLERMRADAVGDTMYSKKFILQVLVKLTKHEGELHEVFENDLCNLWDMSVSPEVVELLLQHETIELIIYQIENNDDMRLYEILIGLLSNMCVHLECVEQLTSNANWIETLLKLSSCMDVGMLLQLMRVYQYIVSHVKTGKEQLGIKWYRYFSEFNNSALNLTLILQKTMNDELLIATLKTINALLARWEMLEQNNLELEPKLKPFDEVFPVLELCESMNIGLNWLMRKNSEENSISEEDGNESTPPKIYCDSEAIQIFLNITAILVEDTEDKIHLNKYAPSVMKSLGSILAFLLESKQLQPLGKRWERYIEDIALISNNLEYFFDKDFFLALLRVWLLLKNHKDKSLSPTFEENSFETDADVSSVNYEDVINQLLTVLANMAITADQKSFIQDLNTIGEQNAQIFISTLAAQQTYFFQNCDENVRKRNFDTINSLKANYV